jgi:hypothetical protein
MPNIEFHLRRWQKAGWRLMAGCCLVSALPVQARGAVAPCVQPLDPAPSGWSVRMPDERGQNGRLPDPVDPCSTIDRGKLLELGPFGGKMLDHAVRDPDRFSDEVVYVGEVPGPDGSAQGAPGETLNPADAPLASQPQPPGSAGRRIMWRQIQ